MNFYHFWIYIHILNTRWFMWTIVWTVFILNMLGPIIIWFVMSGIPLPFTKQKNKKREIKNSSDSS